MSTGLKLLLAIGLWIASAALASPPGFTADWTWELGPAEDASVLLPKHPHYPFVPDGHLTVLATGGRTTIIWPGEPSFLSSGPTLAEQKLRPEPILKAGAPGSFDSGGTWLYAVFPQAGDSWLGFYHAEDRQFVRRQPGDSPDTAWKSIAAATSSDGGQTWTKRGQIITSATPKPAAATWGGSGDFSMIRDQANERWLCFYAEHWLMAAESKDARGELGTWNKFFEGAFTERGLGGKSSPIPVLSAIPGGNPSLHFNTHLKRWIIVWHSWERHAPANSPGLWIASSTDLATWTNPQLLLSAEPGQKVWYPTNVGQESDATAGERATLYYALFEDAGRSERKFLRRAVRFIKN